MTPAGIAKVAREVAEGYQDTWTNDRIEADIAYALSSAFGKFADLIETEAEKPPAGMTKTPEEIAREISDRYGMSGTEFSGLISDAFGDFAKLMEAAKCSKL